VSRQSVSRREVAPIDRNFLLYTLRSLTR